jgi:DNA-binding LacI/PurR family transcriptional regulator
LKKNITIYDVAKHAGVAPGTVSRILNDTGYIKRETRRKVMNSVKELEYIPNVAGRTLKTTKSGLICLAIPDTSNPIYFHMIEAVLETAKKNSYSMLLYYTNGLEEEELNAIRILQGSTVDGLFLVHFSYSSKLREAIGSCVRPIVLCGMCNNLWIDEKVRNFDTLSMDVYKGIYESASYLISRGYKKIAYLAGKQGIEVYRQRYHAYKQALLDHGLEYDESCVYWHGYNEESGSMAARYFYGNDKIPAAVCASNDLQAIGFYKTMQNLGVNVKKAIEIVGLDNLDITEILGLHSMKMFEADVGQKAAELIFLRMKDPFVKLPPQHISFCPELVLRDM